MKPFLRSILSVAVAAAALGSLSCASTGASARIDPSKTPEAVLAESVSADGGSMPGVAVSVIRGGRVVYRGVAGLRVAGSPGPALETDAFHIGSDTKAMTALLCGILVDRGILRWDTTVGEVFGGEYPMVEAYRGVTMAQLLSHTAGLPAGLPGPAWMRFFPYDSPAGADRARMAAESLALTPVNAPGSAFLYSNLGYVVAGRMLELTTGKSWEDLMEEELFRPLGMDGAGFGPPARLASAPWGHSPKPVDPAGPYADNPAALGPAGTVHANLADLERYASLYLGRGLSSSGRRVISEAALEEILRPRLDGYALGWAVLEDSGGRRVIAHDGSNTTFYCSMAIWPDDGDAIIVLANRGDGKAEAAVGALVTYLAERFLGGVE